MNTRNVDVKLGDNGNTVHCIYDTKEQAEKFTNALTITSADGKNTEILYNPKSITEAEDKFIVNISKEVYFQLSQPAPLGKIRKGRDKQNPLWQIVFTDDKTAINYEHQLALMGIAVIKPELKRADGRPIYKEGKWIPDSGVFSNKNEYVIRVDQAGKDKLDASMDHFQYLPSIHQLIQAEKQYKILLYNFFASVVQPCREVKSASLNAVLDVLQKTWISNKKIIETIDEKVNERAGSFILTTFRGAGGEKFQQKYSQFQLKKKADEITNNVSVMNLDCMAELITPYAQEIINKNEQAIQVMNEKIKQMAEEYKNLQMQNVMLMSTVQTQQMQSSQFQGMAQSSAQQYDVSFYPYYGLQPVYQAYERPAANQANELNQSQVINGVTMFASPKQNISANQRVLPTYEQAMETRNQFGYSNNK